MPEPRTEPRTEPRVHIVQCLCPQRHCIMAIAYLPGWTAAQRDWGTLDDVTLTEANAADYLRSMVEGIVARHIINPWCGICHSREWRYEDAVSQFRSIDEAEPFLAQLEREQAATRTVLGQAGQN